MNGTIKVVKETTLQIQCQTEEMNALIIRTKELLEKKNGKKKKVR